MDEYFDKGKQLKAEAMLLLTHMLHTPDRARICFLDDQGQMELVPLPEFA